MQAMPSQQWSGSSGSTPSLSYTIRATKHLIRADPTGNGPCVLAIANIAPGLNVVIPCYACSTFAGYYEYIRRYRSCIAHALQRSYAPHVSPRCSAVVATNFALHFLHPANADRLYPSTSFASVYHVDIVLDPIVGRSPPIDGAAVGRAILDSFEEDRARPKTKPASRRAVKELLVARTESGSDHDCVICLEEIEKPMESLKLPCSHVYHEGCLLRWFETNHVCPLCRYQMPTDP